ncbi:PLP-dependent aminotransferase family protein [Polaribacter porphyrae]|uniref:HTH gntR-type domain-containing protein n=1 Tax=Polaribacter porphyrae TaxID=1137780 RepID=A0A2S7WR01_9FLAO|nr:PLP-dependent aminotransferase family protein [Polaribacter porphyrae]PQJ79701.1 hypothetical protein BTO18_11185 [Polaribacter porphyrae]
MNTNYKFAISRIKEEYENQEKIKPFNIYIVLYRSIKKCIINKDLPHNWVLPSTRYLAEELGFSRTTINKTYELLQLEKLILAKVGSGNRVNYDNSINSIENNDFNKKNKKLKYPKITKKGKLFLTNMSLINRPNDSHLTFKPGLPPMDIFPVNQWKNLLNTYWRHIKSSGLSYHQSTGLEELKKSLRNYLNVSRNIKCNHNQIVVVSGNLQSLYLITSALIEKGDAAILENPTFPNVHSVFKSQGANILGVGLDDEGVDIKKIKSLNNLKPKLIHTTPSNHYPTGVKMSLKRRKELLKWASKNKGLIIENDYENEVANYTESLPSIFSLDKEDRTIYLSTFNRLLHPSLRLGFMIVPNFLRPTIEALQEHSHRFVTPSIQVVMNQFIERNYLFQHIKNITKTAKLRHETFVKEFENNNKTMFIEHKVFSNFHVIAKFKKPVSEKKELAIVKKLSQHKIVVFSLSKCFLSKEKEQGLIFGYAAVRLNVIKQKVIQMKEILNKEF